MPLFLCALISDTIEFQSYFIFVTTNFEPEHIVFLLTSYNPGAQVQSEYKTTESVTLPYNRSTRYFIYSY